MLKMKLSWRLERICVVGLALPVELLTLTKREYDFGSHWSKEDDKHMEKTRTQTIAWSQDF